MNVITSTYNKSVKWECIAPVFPNIFKESFKHFAILRSIGILFDFIKYNTCNNLPLHKLSFSCSDILLKQFSNMPLRFSFGIRGTDALAANSRVL